MKKNEALEIAPQRVKVIIDYITSILEANQKVEGRLEFSSSKINNEHMCTMDIFVPISNFEKHINLGITIDHCDILYEILFEEFINNFLAHDYLGVTRYQTINFIMSPSFHGVTAVNSHTGSNLKINFFRFGNKFDTITSNYNQRINSYIESQSNQHHRK